MRARANLVAGILTALFILHAPAFAKGPFGSIRIAGWSGGAFTDDATGSFSSCIVSANYKSGINVGIVVSKNITWALAFSDNRWNLSRNQTFPIVLSFDGRSSFNVKGSAISSDTVMVPMPDNSALIRSFRAARIMSAFASGNLFQFSLTGTSALLPVMVTCAKTMNAVGVAKATDFVALHKMATAPSSAPAMGPERSATAVSSIKPNSPQEGSVELQFEAMQMASSFILKASLDQPALLSREETPIAIAATGAAWKANNATGFVRIIPPQQNVSGLDVAATITGNDAKECKGKFASARNSELVDSEVVFRGMSSCEDSEHSVIAEYFIFPRKKGGFVMFSVLTPSKSIAQQVQGQKRDEMNAGFRQAAYTSIGK